MFTEELEAGAAPEVASELVERAPEGSEVAAGNPLQVIKAGLDAIAAEFATLDLSIETARTVKGEKALRDFTWRCTRLRTAADEAYATVNAPLLKAQREARALLADIKAGIEPHESKADAVISQVKEIKERERAEREASEKARTDAIRAKIALMVSTASRAVGKPSADIVSKRELIAAMVIDAAYAEFEAEATETRNQVLLQLDELIDATKAHEAERAAAARAAELERQLNEIRIVPLRYTSPNVTDLEIHNAIALLELPVDSDHWGEFFQRAMEARDLAVDQLKEIQARRAEEARQRQERERIEREAAEQRAEQQRLEAERQQRLAADEAERKAAQARADEQAAEVARQQAEAQRIIDQTQREMEAQAEALRRQQAEIDAQRAAMAAPPAVPAPAPAFELSGDQALSLGAISARLGLVITGDFLEGTLRIAHTGVSHKRKTKTWSESKWPAIKAALIAYIKSLP